MTLYTGITGNAIRARLAAESVALYRVPSDGYGRTIDGQMTGTVHQEPRKSPKGWVLSAER